MSRARRDGIAAWCISAVAVALGLAACGDDAATSSPDATAADVTTSPSGDTGVDRDASDDAASDAGVRNTCLDPARQSLPCCWERSNAERAETELIVRSMRFAAPAAAANAIFEAQIQSAFDELRVPWLIDVREIGGETVARTGFGVLDAETGTYRFSENDAPPPGEPTRRRPVSMRARIDATHFETDAATAPLLIPIIGGASEGQPQPEIIFRQVRFLASTLTDERTCVGARTPSRRWTYGEPPSRVEAYMLVDDAIASVIPALGDVTFCSFLAGAACDEARPGWATPPDARCDADGDCTAVDGACERDSDDPATGCNAWRFEIAYAASGVEIE